MEERIARLEAQSFAYGMVLGNVIAAAWPKKDHRAAVRDICCDSIEAIYASKINPGGHEQIQRVLHEIEELFQLAEGAAKAIPKD